MADALIEATAPRGARRCSLTGTGGPACASVSDGRAWMRGFFLLGLLHEQGVSPQIIHSS
jgi:hypothetical protein